MDDDDHDSMGSWEINDIDDQPVPSPLVLLQSTPIRTCDKGGFGNKAPYTLSPINRTSTTPLRLFTPPRPFHANDFKSPQSITPQQLSSDTSEVSPIIRRRRRRRQILVSDDDDDVDDVPPPIIKSSTKRKRPWMEKNPFLDTEAIRSDDDVSTDDDDDDGDGDGEAGMDSFIHDGSSGLAPEPDAMAMYRTSLHQSEYRRKTWLDKMSTEKWEMADDDDDDQVLDDDDNDDDHSKSLEENISSFTNASDDFI